MSNIDQAVQCFQNGFNCSQAVFSAYCEQLGLDEEIGLKISCPFGAGIGRMAETCGAVSGAFLLIGLKYGKYLEGDDAAKLKTYELVQEFSNRFKEIHGSILCRDLLNCNLSTPEGMTFAKDNGLFEKECPVFVRDAAAIIEELLELE